MALSYFCPTETRKDIRILLCFERHSQLLISGTLFVNPQYLNQTRNSTHAESVIAKPERSPINKTVTNQHPGGYLGRSI